jgi:response regulator NasT
MYRVLIAEDDALVALSLAELVRSAGHRVVAMASHADRAVELARDERPDVCLFDVRLADGSDGLAASLEVQNGLGLPVIIISASMDAALAAQHGVRAWLEKPVETRRLLQTILAVGNGARPQRIASGA